MKYGGTVSPCEAQEETCGAVANERDNLDSLNFAFLRLEEVLNAQQSLISKISGTLDQPCDNVKEPTKHTPSLQELLSGGPNHMHEFIDRALNNVDTTRNILYGNN